MNNKNIKLKGIILCIVIIIVAIITTFFVLNNSGEVSSTSLQSSSNNFNATTVSSIKTESALRTYLTSSTDYVINIASNITITSPIEIVGNKTINGNGYTITSNITDELGSLSGVFYNSDTGGDIVFDNLKIVGDDINNLIYVCNLTTNITIQNSCDFRNGYDLIFDFQIGKLTISDSSLYYTGSSNYCYIISGSYGSREITNCYINGNDKAYAIYSNGNYTSVVVNDTTFENCGTGVGGHPGSETLSNCIFNNCNMGLLPSYNGTTLNSVEFNNCKYGIWCTNGYFTYNSGSVSNNTYDIYIKDTQKGAADFVFTITDEVTGNPTVYLEDDTSYITTNSTSPTFTVVPSTFTAGRVVAKSDTNAVATATLANLTLSGNDNYQLAISEDDDTEIILQGTAMISLLFYDYNTGSQFQDKQTFYGEPGEEFTYTVPVIEGYQYGMDGWDEDEEGNDISVFTPYTYGTYTATFGKVNSEYTIALCYAKTHTITINYKDRSDGSTIQAATVLDTYESATYNLNSYLNLSGYTFNYSSGCDLTGTVGDDDLEITLYYDKNTSVIVNYVDYNDQTNILDTVTIEGYVGKSYSAEIKEFEGYVLISDTDNSTGTMVEETIELTYYYAEEASIIVKFVDNSDNTTVLYQETKEAYIGKTYNISNSVTGYTVVSDSGNTSGTVETATVEVIFYCAKNTSVQVKYVDKNSLDEITDSIAIDGYVGKTYDTSSYLTDLTGYTYVSTDGDTTGTMTKDGITVIYYYAKSTSVVVKYVNYNDPNNTLDTATISGYVGKDYDVSSYLTDLTGYTYVSTDGDTTGTMTESVITITYYYALNSSVTVKYVDQNNNTNITTLIISGYEGKEYSTAIQNLNGYTYLSCSDNTTGIMTKEAITVYYYYAITSNVIINYVDQNNAELKTETVVGYEGKSYDISSYLTDIEGYTYLSTDGDLTGTMLDSDITITLNYSKNTSVQVKYVDLNSQSEITDSVTIEGYIGKDYDTSSYLTDITGYTYISTEGDTTGTMTEETIEVTYYYAKTSNIIIKYVDQDSNELKAETVIGYEGKTYDVNSYLTDIEGYTYLSTDGDLTGTMLDSDITITFKYSKNTSVLVKYIDLNSNDEIADSESIDGYIGKDYDTSSYLTDITGYTYISTDGTVAGTMTNEVITVTYYYAKTSNIIIKYVDQDENEINGTETVTLEGYEGKTYDISSYLTDIAGYEYLSTEGNLTGTYTSSDITITFKYSKIISVVTKFIDKNSGDEIDGVEAITTVGYVGKAYDVSQYLTDINGYTYLSTDGDMTGTMTDNVITVTHYYAKTSNIIIKYIDKNSNKEIDNAETVTITGYEGKSYDVSSYLTDIEGYTYLSTDGDTTGTMLDSDITITYYYAITSNVIIKYVDKNSNEEITGAETVTITGYEGKSYSTTLNKKDITDYTYISSTDNTEGTMTSLDITVIYYYSKNTTVLVKYVDINNQSNTLDTATLNGYVGKTYDTTEYNKTIDNYTYLQNSGNTEGTMTEETIEVIYYYAKTSSVIIKYIDQDENEINGTETVTLEGYEGKTYDISSYLTDIAGYEYLSTEGNLTGTYTSSDITITFKYSKIISVVTKFIDKNSGDEIDGVEAITTVGYVGKAYDVSQYLTDINGYTYLSTDGDMTGTMTDDIIYVTHYYSKNVSILVKYVDKVNGDILDTETLEGLVGDTVNSVSKAIDGYTLVESPDTEEFTLDYENDEVVYYYNINSNIIVKCVDKTNGDVLSSSTIEGYEGKDYDVSSYLAEIESYTYSSSTNNETGTFGRQNTEVIFYYLYNSPGLIVNYVEYSNPSNILDSVSYTEMLEGDTIETKAKTISLYKLVESPTNTTITLTKELQTVTYYYTALSFSLGLNSEVTDVNLNGTSYGTAGLTELYDRDDVSSLYITYKITVTNDGELISGGTLLYTIPTGFSLDTEINESWTTDGTYGYYDITDLQPGESKDVYVTLTLTGNYSSLNSTIANNISLINTYSEAGQEEDVTISEENQEVIEKLVTLTVNAIDIDTNKVLETKKYYGYDGNKYEIDVFSISDYELISSENLDGTYSKDIENIINIYYQKQDRTINVYYIDELTGDTLFSETLTGKNGSNYQANVKEIEGYILLNTSGNTSGAFSSENEDIYYYYRKEAKVLINYIDKATGSIISSNTINGYIGKEYSTDMITIDNYTYISSTNNTTGTMTDNTITVEYYYLYNSKITVKYINQDTGEILDEIIYEGLEGEKISTTSKDYTLYKLVGSPETEEYTYTKENTEVIYYYTQLKFSLSLSSEMSDAIINGTSYGAAGKYELYRKDDISSMLLTYKITVTNDGNLAAWGTILDTIPTGFILDTALNPGWTTDGTYAYYNIENLAAGETRDVYITLTLAADYSSLLGEIVNNVNLVNVSSELGTEEVELTINQTEESTSIPFILTIATGITKNANQIIAILGCVFTITAGILIYIKKKLNK